MTLCVWGASCAGDKQGGSVRVLYDHTLSTRGVLLATGRKPRAKDPFDFQAGGFFICPVHSIHSRLCQKFHLTLGTSGIVSIDVLSSIIYFQLCCCMGSLSQW